MWHSLNKIIEKEKTLFKTKKQLSLSSLSRKKFQTALSPSPSRCFSPSSSSTIVAQQSFNLWCPFLLQIAKGGHFRSREARLYEWDFETSEASGNRLAACVIDYTEEWVTGNRLPDRDGGTTNP
ncbi:hypothetical protein GmHk_06G016860 [Glycine max]|nr:hypothetical protein GmHk_06G016860 [Glycine max]